MSFNQTHCYGEFNLSPDYVIEDLLKDIEELVGEPITVSEVTANHQMMTGTNYPSCVL